MARFIAAHRGKFALAFVRANSPAALRAMATELAAAVAEERLKLVEVDGAKYDPGEGVTELLANPLFRSPDAVFLLTGFENAVLPDVFDERPCAFVRDLNLRRDAFREIRGPVLLCLSSAAMARVFRDAPDFADWRGTTFELEADELIAGSIVGDHRAAAQPYSRERLAVLESQIRGLEAAGKRSVSAEIEAAGIRFRISYGTGELQDAYEASRSLEALATETDDRLALALSLGNRALVLRRWGRLDESLDLHRLEQSLFQEAGNEAGVHQSLGNQAFVLEARGRLEEAMALHKQVEAYYVRVGDKLGLSRAYGNQAIILEAWGRLDEAMALHISQERLCRELGDQRGISASLGNQAIILKMWGRLDEALIRHRQEEAICRDLGDKAGLRTSLGNQALIFKAWGQLDQAMELLKRHETLCRQLGDRAGLALSWGNQALILKAWARLNEAIELLKRQESVCLEIGDKAGLARSLGNQANIAQIRGDFALARTLRAETLRLFTELGMPIERDKSQRLLDDLGP